MHCKFIGACITSAANGDLRCYQPSKWIHLVKRNEDKLEIYQEFRNMYKIL